MYSEILADGFTEYYDTDTASCIGYDTSSGVWISYLNKKSIDAQIKYAMGKGLGGSFSWDCSMDTISGGKFTYELTN